MSLHEKYLPVYDFSERHRLDIKAPTEVVANCVEAASFSDSFLIKLLTRLRGMPRTQGGIESVTRMGFVLLERDAGREVILGLIGQFWKPSGNIIRVGSAVDFERFNEDSFLKATWNFAVRETTMDSSVLETETRIQCLGTYAKRKFSRYWFFIRPFSGLIRMEMLRSIRRKAEAEAFAT